MIMWSKNHNHLLLSKRHLNLQPGSIHSNYTLRKHPLEFKLLLIIWHIIYPQLQSLSRKLHLQLQAKWAVPMQCWKYPGLPPAMAVPFAQALHNLSRCVVGAFCVGAVPAPEPIGKWVWNCKRCKKHGLKGVYILWWKLTRQNFSHNTTRLTALPTMHMPTR